MRERNFTKRLFSIKRKKNSHVPIIMNLSISRFEYSIFWSNYDYAIFKNCSAHNICVIFLIQSWLSIAINKITNNDEIILFYYPNPPVSFFQRKTMMADKAGYVGFDVKLVTSNSKERVTQRADCYVSGSSVTRRYSVPRYEFVGSSVERNNVMRISRILHPFHWFFHQSRLTFWERFPWSKIWKDERKIWDERNSSSLVPSRFI